jgi:hypothetical protein
LGIPNRFPTPSPLAVRGALRGCCADHKPVAVGVATREEAPPRLVLDLTDLRAASHQRGSVGFEFARLEHEPGQRTGRHVLEPRDQGDRRLRAGWGELDPSLAGSHRIVSQNLEAKDVGVEGLGPVLIGYWNRQHLHIGDGHDREDTATHYACRVPEEVSSPRVETSSWGQIVVQGLGQFRDVKLWPGGGRAWDWNETGTCHRPGIQPSDVEELLAHSPELIVLSRGRQLQLQTAPETLALLEQHHIAVVQEETSMAIEAYNRSAQSGGRVAALIHSTC